MALRQLPAKFLYPTPHLGIPLRGEDSQGRCYVSQGVHAKSNALLADKGSEGGLVPDDDRQVAVDVERSLVGIIILQVLPHVSLAGVDGATIPHQTEMSLGRGDELAGRYETHLLETLRVNRVPHVEPTAIKTHLVAPDYVAHLIEESVLAGTEHTRIDHRVGAVWHMGRVKRRTE